MKLKQIRQLAAQQRQKYEQAQTSDVKLMTLNLTVHCTELIILAQGKVLVAANQGHDEVQVPTNSQYDADVLHTHFTSQRYSVTRHTSPLGALYLTISWE